MLEILNLSLPKCSLESVIRNSQISSKNAKPFWSYCLGRATEAQLPFKDERPKDIGHNMTMVLDTRKSNFVSA